MRRGLGRLRDGRFERVPAADDLGSDAIQALFEDREGSLWIGTGSGGLHRLKDVAFTGIGRRTACRAIRPGRVRGRRGRIWIGGDGGLDLVSEGRAALPGPGRPAGRGRPRHCRRPRGELLGGHLPGPLAAVRNGRATLFTTREGLSDNRVLTPARGPRGRPLDRHLIRGLNRLQDGRITAYTQAAGFRNDRIYALHEDRSGDLWIGTKDGLHRFAGGRVEALLPRAGAPSGSVFSFSEDAAGTLWIGASEGLFRYHAGALHGLHQLGGTAGGRHLHRARRPARQPLGVQQGAAAPPQGRAGPLRHRAQGSHPLAGLRGGGRHAELGMQRRRPARRAGSRDGRLWFPTVRGVAVIRSGPPAAQPGAAAGDPRGDHSRASAASRPAARSGCRLGTDRFRDPLHRAQPGRSREGALPLPAGRVRPGLGRGRGPRSADYTNLPPGAYTFRVTASNDEGVWNEAGARRSGVVPARL